jgi:hypothetical protein
MTTLPCQELRRRHDHQHGGVVLAKGLAACTRPTSEVFSIGLAEKSHLRAWGALPAAKQTQRTQVTS